MKITGLRGTLVTLCVTALAAGVLAGTTSANAAPAASGSLQQNIPEPDDDAFYQPADGFESKAPGTVLKKREVTVNGLAAQQIQVRSSDAKDRPVTVVSTIIVPPGSYPGGGERPLLSYQPATDSLGDQCNPSYTVRAGSEKEFPLLSMGLAQGWAVVVTDYQGPRDAYGAGRMEDHGVLDGIRGVKTLPGLTKSPVGLWGYSGGGLASGWAAELQPTYAPGLKLAGVAAGGMPSDFAPAAKIMDGGPFSGLALGAIVGISREYPELLVLMNDAGRKLRAEVDDMCVRELATGYAFKRIRDYTTSFDPLNEPIAKQVLARNKMGSDNPAAPVYLFHSFFDELIPYSTAKTIAAQWCAQGTKVTFYTDYLSEHSSLAVTGAPAAVGYLAARFRGVAVPSTC